MAIVTAGANFALDTTGTAFFYTVSDDDVLIASPTLIRVRASNGNYQDYTGSFSYGFDPTAGYYLSDGVVTGLAEYTSGSSLVYSVTGLSVTASQFNSYVLADDAAGLRAFGLRGNDTIIGSSQSDVLAGYAGADRLSGLGGNDTIYGGTELDTAVFSGNRSDYQIVKDDGAITVIDTRGVDGTDTLYDVETLEFNHRGYAANSAPVVTIPIVNATPAHGRTSIAPSSLFFVSDSDGDTIQSYEFWDSGVDANSGRFVLSGVTQGTNVAVPISAANLANLSFRLGAVSDQLWVRAYDGVAWSTWKSINVAVPANAAPVVANVTPAHGATSIAASSLFSISDSDGDTIQSYEFWDSGLDPNSGRFALSGVIQGTDVAIPVTAANLPNLSFRFGAVSDQLWVRAYDGTAWSKWSSVSVAAPPNAAPVVAIPNANVTPAHAATSINASILFSVNDEDGDTIQSYEFWDSGMDANSGRFVLAGVTQGIDVAIPVSAVNLANLSFRLGTASDLLWVRAYDGTSWSAWNWVNVAAPPNTAPVVTVSDRSLSADAAVPASTLFTVNDADNDTMTKYQFWDSTPGGGTFRINGAAQPVNANIDIMADQLAAADFLSGATAGTDQVWARAFDGFAWSTWEPFKITTLAST